MLALRERITKFLGGDRRELLVQIGWQGALVAAIDPIQRYTVAIANFRCHVDGYASPALLKRIVEISLHPNLSTEFGLRQPERLARFK